MNLNQQLKIIHLLNHCVLVYFLYFGNLWLSSISFLIFQILIIIGVSSGLHRYYTHKSFDTNKFWQRVMLFVSIPATLGTPISWISTHRLHHAYSEKEKDPHSPLTLGFLRSYFHIWNHINIPSRLVSDIVKNDTIKFIHTHYIKILVFYILMLYFINPTVGIIVYSIPAVLMFHATSLINALGHKWGYRNFDTDDNSRNSKITGILLGGEGLHNNHHKNPQSPNFSYTPNEFDISWHFIKLIRT